MVGLLPRAAGTYLRESAREAVPEPTLTNLGLGWLILTPQRCQKCSYQRLRVLRPLRGVRCDYVVSARQVTGVSCRVDKLVPIEHTSTLRPRSHIGF